MRKREIICEYQPYVMAPPASSDQLYSKAAANDGTTIERWQDTWIENISTNHEKFGGFSDKALGNLYGRYLHRPVICAGSGPSLKWNWQELKNRGSIPLVSCLHNFQFFEDRDINPDFYVSLDAGPITVDEVSEGGQHEPEWYWERTAGHKLLCFIGSDPKLLEKWQGEIYFYNAPVPSESYRERVQQIEVFNQWVSNGGNVLGACMYISKGYFGASTIIYVGADFSFGYDHKFHGWDSKYDAKMGHCIRATDIFGHSVSTWQSYNNFKSWFDWVSMNVPGEWINCTEGGTMGAYPTGNIISIKQMDLKDCLNRFSMSQVLKPSALDPKVEGDDGRRILF